MLELVILDGDGAQYAIPEGGELRIGVAAGCAVRLASDDVSRVHALVADRGGRVVLLDLGSKNGTFINGRRIREVEVSAGDLVRFSSVAGQFVNARERVVAGGSGNDGACVTVRSDAAPTGEAVPLDLASALNKLLGSWRRDDSVAVASLILWLVERRGMRGAAVLDVVGDEVTVGASHGSLGHVLQDPQCLAILKARRAQGHALETVQCAIGEERVLGISARALPWLLLLPCETMPDACEVELLVHLLALARRLEDCVTGTSRASRKGLRRR